MDNTSEKWAKMSGAGNCFLVTHLNRSQLKNRRNWAALSRRLCHQNKTDGLVVLKPSEKADWEWLFYQKDGSTAEMCGNAGCCAVEYLFKKKLTSSQCITLKTGAGIIKGVFQQTTGNSTTNSGTKNGKIFIKQIQNIRGPFRISFENHIFSYLFIHALVPHAVMELRSLSAKTDLYTTSLETSLGQKLRRNHTHHKNGMNVSFYTQLKTISDKNNMSPVLRAATFERGVEQITPACGTGAIAIAHAYRHCHHSKISKVFVQMPGGQLTVQFYSNGQLSLSSPVEWITNCEG